MPVPKKHIKPIFHEKTLRKAVAAFPFSADLMAHLSILENWAVTLKSGTLDQIKEVSLHGKFLIDIFESLLGYGTVVDGKGSAWNLHPEQTMSSGGGSADGALGFFTSVDGKKGKKRLTGSVVAPIELKDAKTDLDLPQPGRHESPVDQGWRYANHTEDCRWLIVSNYREIRLYRTSKTPAYYERFLLEDLVEPEEFKRFYFVLCKENFLPYDGGHEKNSFIDHLLSRSDSAQQNITNLFYDEYKQTRLRLIDHLHTGVTDSTERMELIEKAQKVLDRLLFIAFCEDCGLMPEKTIQKAHEHRDPYSPTSVWDRFKAVFRWVDQGHDDPPIPGYDGGLFKYDPVLDGKIVLTDRICESLVQLSRYDFDTDLSVDILGHIFEQSITDLEELKAAAEGKPFEKKRGKRRTQGVFYTPAFITEYIVDLALGGYLRRKESALRPHFELDQIPESYTRKRQKAEIGFYEEYRDTVLRKTRVLDPACGSGAFLIAAFDYLLHEYERVNNALSGLKGGQHSLFDLNKTILNENLFGVDISKESVEITKLSLWLKTAERGKTLTFIDDNIQQGNSIISDSDVDPAAFNWEARFPHVPADGGFDVVIGNPPYIRQELLSPIKPYLERYQSYDSVADVYSYFLETGVNLLKPGGLLSFIISNKWLRSGYGQSLRSFLVENTIFEQIVDFGHAPIFEDADVFPCIVLTRKPEPVETEGLTDKDRDGVVLACSVPRNHLADISLKQYVNQFGSTIPRSRFSGDLWSLESHASENLEKKILEHGTPLEDFSGSAPLSGIKTGFNNAFLLDTPTKEIIVSEDARSLQVLRPYLRGQDFSRWNADWAGLWMITLKSSENHEWPWANSGPDAEAVFRNTYPAIYGHMNKFRDALASRQDQGRFWWELRSCAYWEEFEKPKIMYPEITWRLEWCLDVKATLCNNTAYILPSDDLWIPAVLNSPTGWWIAWRTAMHGKDEALRFIKEFVKRFPVPEPNSEQRQTAEKKVERLIEITRISQGERSALLDWLRVEQFIDKPSRKLTSVFSLDSDSFVAEVKRLRGKSRKPFTAAALRALRDEYTKSVPPTVGLLSEARTLEYALNNLVNQAYGLTPGEVDLLWSTAPPRMPTPRG
ncbi:MAG: Eco57I restriction-modification methylase domain-containing protein [Pseudomonadota bacterium]